MTRITSMPDVLPAYPYSKLAHIRPGSYTGSSNESRKPTSTDATGLLGGGRLSDVTAL